MSKFNIKDIIWDFLELLIICASIIALTFWFVGQPVQVSGSSMEPNLSNNQQLIAEKLTYKLREPERGEVAILKHPENPPVLLVKRIVGLPGDTFEIKDGQIYVNGSKLEEPYINNSELTQGKNKLKDNQKIKVPEDKYIVLGDNRDDSADSRNWGFIDEGSLVGRASLVYAPISEFKLIK